MMSPPERTARNEANVGLPALLHEDHARLERQFADVLAAFRANQRDVVQREWVAFESSVRAHFDMEEREMIPELRKSHPDEAQDLLGEHARIRAKLDEMSIDVDLHLARAEAVAALVRELKAHGKREDALMYAWARSNLRPETQASIRAQVMGALKRFVGRA